MNAVRRPPPLNSDPISSMRERAASLKASVSRVIHQKLGSAASSELPAGAPTGAVSTELAAMIGEWVRLRAVHDSGTLSDEEGNAISAQWSNLQDVICRFEAVTFADLCAKTPIYRYERDDEEASGERGPNMPLRAWDSVLKDIEALGRARVATSEVDPILASIQECHRLLDAYMGVHLNFPQDPSTIDPPEEWDIASEVLRSHIRDAILRTVPRTAAGCRELARFAVEYLDRVGIPIADDEEVVARLIAKSPLL